MLESVLNILLSPVIKILSPDSKLFWLYLVSSVFIFLLFALGKMFTEKDFRFYRYYRENFSGSIFWSKSARVDYLFYIINGILFAAILNYFLLTTLFIANLTAALLHPVLGNFSVNSGSVYIQIIYSVLYFVFYDFGRFLPHYFFHKNSVLWEFHKFHHSATTLNPVTVFRVHPVEAILINSSGGFFSGLLTGVFFAMSPNGIKMITFLGVNAGLFVFYLFANLRHSHIFIRFPEWLSHLILSPAQHQIHHSNNPALQNKNFGVAFAFWDYLLGSLYIPAKDENGTITFGLQDEPHEPFEKLTSIYFSPFKNIVQLLRKARKEKNHPTAISK